MPTTTHINISKDLTAFKVKGILSFEEVMSNIKDFYDRDPTKNVLWDLLDVSENLITLEQMEKIISFPPRFKGEGQSGKTAIVAQNSFLMGLANVLGMENNLLKAPYTVMVFNSLDSAYKWFDEP